MKLIEVGDGAARVEIDGKPLRLLLGQSPIRSETSSSAPAGVTLYADGRGHYLTQGSVNGAPVRFLVDTGASMVSLGSTDASRAGIDVRSGDAGFAQTANGVVRVWRHRLDTVKVGEVTLHGVDALVHEHDLPVTLLGMSFLNRMDMERQGDRLILRKRY